MNYDRLHSGGTAEEQRRKSEAALESHWSSTDLLDTLILNYAIKTSTFTFCPETLCTSRFQGKRWRLMIFLLNSWLCIVVRLRKCTKSVAPVLKNIQARLISCIFIYYDHKCWGRHHTRPIVYDISHNYYGNEEVRRQKYVK